MNNLRTMMGGVTAFIASTLAFSNPVYSISFTPFTDEGNFRAAAGSISTENFDSFTSDASFNNGETVNLRDFSLTGIGQASPLNIIDVSPLVIPIVDVNETPLILGFVGLSNSGDNVSFNTTFKSPISAFGASFAGVSSFGIVRLRADGVIVGEIPNTAFYGFTADSNFSTITFEIAGANNDGFGADDFLYSTPTPVPYEFEMASGVVAFGVWLSRKKVIAKIKSWRSKDK